MTSLNKITFSEVLKSRRAILISYIAMTLSFLFRKSRQRTLKSKSRRAILTRSPLRKSTTLSTCLKSKKSVASKKRSNRTILQRFDIEAHSQRRIEQEKRKNILQLNVCEIEVISFNRLNQKKNHDIFVLSLKEIDRFLKKKVSFSSAINLSSVIDSSSRYQSLSSQFSLVEKKIHLVLFKMNKILALRTSVISKELVEYRENKNVDSTSLLSQRYHEFLNVFSKKNFDILLDHCLYDHVIKLKKDA
jgi:hypothetical protein